MERIKNYKIEKVTTIMEGNDYTGTFKAYIKSRRTLKPEDKSKPTCKYFTLDSIMSIGYNPYYYNTMDFKDEKGDYMYIGDYTNSMYEYEHEFIEEFIPHFMEYCEKNKLTKLEFMRSSCDIALAEYDPITDDLEEGIYSGIVEDIYARHRRKFKRLEWEYDRDKFTFKIKNDFLSKNYLVSGTGEEFYDNIFEALRDYNNSWNEKLLKLYPIEIEQMKNRD